RTFRRPQSVGYFVGAELAQPRLARMGWRRLGRGRLWRRRGLWRLLRRRRSIGVMVMQLSDADRQKVAAAIAAAEAKSSGEIVAVATPISDAYHDVALHWALVPLFAVLAWAAWRPTALA